LFHFYYLQFFGVSTFNTVNTLTSFGCTESKVPSQFQTKSNHCTSFGNQWLKICRKLLVYIVFLMCYVTATYIPAGQQRSLQSRLELLNYLHSIVLDFITLTTTCHTALASPVNYSVNGDLRDTRLLVLCDIGQMLLEELLTSCAQGNNNERVPLWRASW